MTIGIVGYSVALSYVHVPFWIDMIPGLKYLYTNFFLIKIQIDMFATYGLAVAFSSMAPEYVTMACISAIPAMLLMHVLSGRPLVLNFF